MLDQRLERMLSHAANLPTLPSVALQIVRLASDEHTSVREITLALEKDPVLAARILRVANSPIYACREKIESVKQAVVVLGMRGTQSLALSFSLMNSFRAQQGKSLDYQLFWRRSLLAATVARMLGQVIGERDCEALFLAALVQDLGMLVLDRMEPGFYARLGDDQRDHGAVLRYEGRYMSSDHATIGAWILRKWELSKRLALAVEGSHDPLTLLTGDDVAPFIRCVALAGPVADLLIQEGGSDHFAEVVELAGRYLHIGGDTVSEVLHNVARCLPEFERSFDMRLMEPEKLQMITDMARETLAQLQARKAAS